MTNIEQAKIELQKVGALLSKDMSNPAIKSILLKLKAVNTDLTTIINGGGTFSFDDMDEGVAARPQQRVREATTASTKDTFGVDLGGFDNFVNQQDPDGFDWRETMREANGGKANDLGDWDPSQEAYESTLGRMVDRT